MQPRRAYGARVTTKSLRDRTTDEIVARGWVFVPMAFVLAACRWPVPAAYKDYMCSEAARGARFRCEYLEVARDTCEDIASEAFRLCYDSLPEEHVNANPLGTVASAARDFMESLRHR